MTSLSRLAHRLLTLSLDCSPSRSFLQQRLDSCGQRRFRFRGSAVSMQLRTLWIKDKAGLLDEKVKRLSNDHRVQLIMLLCFPVVFSSSHTAPPVKMRASRIAEMRPANPTYRSRVTECRYPAGPDVSVVRSSMKHFSKEEFFSTLKNCVDPRGFRWSAII